MLGINRQDRHLIGSSQVRNQLACHDQRLFIGQCNGLFSLDSCYGWTQSGIADHSRQHHIDRFPLYDLGNRIRPSPHLDRQILQGLLQLRILLFIGDHHHFRHELTCLIYQLIHLIIGGQRIYVKEVGMFMYHL